VTIFVKSDSAKDTWKCNARPVAVSPSSKPLGEDGGCSEVKIKKEEVRNSEVGRKEL
jgi:hypothetical protein